MEIDKIAFSTNLSRTAQRKRGISRVLGCLFSVFFNLLYRLSIGLRPKNWDAIYLDYIKEMEGEDMQKMTKAYSLYIWCVFHTTSRCRLWTSLFFSWTFLSRSSWKNQWQPFFCFITVSTRFLLKWAAVSNNSWWYALLIHHHRSSSMVTFSPAMSSPTSTIKRIGCYIVFFFLQKGLCGFMPNSVVTERTHLWAVWQWSVTWLLPSYII